MRSAVFVDESTRLRKTTGEKTIASEDSMAVVVSPLFGRIRRER